MLKIKISFLICLLISVTTISYSQSGWFSQNFGYNRGLADVQFLDLNTGFSVGLGIILKTTNAGQNWNCVLNDTLLNEYMKLHFINVNTGYVIGDNLYSGKILMKSNNGGNNWYSIETGFQGGYYGAITFTSGNTGYLGVSDDAPITESTILKTTNAGLNWFTCFNHSGWNTEVISSFYFLDLNTGYAGNWGRILKTTNGGLNWIYITLNEQNINVLSIQFLNSSIGYACGYATNFQPAGRFMKTSDGGLSWSIHHIDEGLPCRDVFFTSLDTGYITNQYFIWKTTNQGTYWLQSHFSVQFHNSLFFTTQQTGYCVGPSGYVLKTTNGGITYLKNEKSEIPQYFSLSQNYPNPFNPVTKIKFDIPTPLNPPFAKGGTAKPGGFVRLTIYDALGREISALVDEQLNPGSYEVEWDASNFPGGVYFYRLTAGDPSTGSGLSYSETKKMILIK